MGKYQAALNNLKHVINVFGANKYKEDLEGYHAVALVGYNEDGTPGGDYLGGVVYVTASTSASFAILEDSKVVAWGGCNNDATCWTDGIIYEPIYVKDAKGTSFMEDYTYNFVPGKEGIRRSPEPPA